MKKLVYIFCLFMLFCLEVLAQDFWQQTNGPYDGAFIKSLTIGPDAAIYAGTQTQGLFKSSNGGYNWFRIGLEGKTVNTILSYSDQVILVGTDDGFYQSWDSGNNWTKNSTILNANTFCKTENGLVFIGTYKQIFRSTDEGNNWSDVTTNISNLEVGCIAVDSSGKLFATTSQGIFISTDDGISWNHNSDIGIPGWKSKMSNIIFVKDSEHIFLYTSSEYMGIISSGFYLSTDGGENWMLQNSSLQLVSQLAVHQTGGLLVSISSNGSGGIIGGVLFSSDDGSTWNSFHNEVLNYSVNALITTGEAQILAGTDYAGFFLSKDSGNSWENLNAGINNSDLVEVYASPKGSIFCSRASFSYGHSGIYRSRDEGSSWEKLNMGIPDPNVRAFFYDRNGNIYAGDPGIYRSSNDGNDWQMIRSWEAVDCFAETPNGTLIAGCGNEDGILRSTNNGISWMNSNSGLTSLTIFSLAATDLGTVLAGSYEGKIFRSTDDGINWKSVTTPSNLTVTALYKTKDNIILAGTIDNWSVSSILISSDEGITWISDNSFVNKRVRDISENSQGDIFVACEYEGIYKSQDKGKTWSFLSNQGLSDLRVQTICISTEGYLYAGTWRGSLFRSKETTTNVVIEDEKILIEYLLVQNYPNPFNPATKIEYSIPQTSFVTLKVYDILCREVASLVNEEKLAGRYSIKFNGSELDSGIYFYKLQTASYSSVKKMILIK